MADDSDSIGNIKVSITGDYSGLIDDLNIVENLASSAGAKIADGFSSSTSAIDKNATAMEALRAQIAATGGVLDTQGSSANTASAGLENMAKAQAALGDAAAKSAPALGQTGSAIETAGKAAESGLPSFQELAKAALAFTGVELSAKALLNFAESALETYAEVQKATISIDALTGSTGKAYGIISDLKGLAIEDALSFPSLVTAEQRMLAFGVKSADIPVGLRLIADTAAALGRNFDQMSDRFDRVIESGNISARTLVLLGLNMRDVATAMGTTESAASSAFKALDQSERIGVLQIALEKFEGTASKVADSLAGQWQNLKTQADFAFASIGQSLEPLATGLIKVGTEAVKETGGMASGFNFVSNAVDNFYEHLYNLEHGIDDNSQKLAANKKVVDDGSISWRDFVPSIEMFGTAFQYMTDIVDVASGQSFPRLGKSVEDMIHSIAKGAQSGEEFKKAWDLSQLAAGIIPVTSAMEGIEKKQKDLQATYDASTTALERLTRSFQNQEADAKGHIATEGEVNAAYAAQQKALSALDTTASGHIKTAEQLGHREGELQEAVEKARQAVQDAISADDGSAKAKAVLKAANEQLTAATKAAHMATADGVLSMGELLNKNRELNAALGVAEQAYLGITARIKAGSGEYNAQSEALKQLIKVHKDLGDAETNVDIIIATTEQKNADLTDKITAQYQAVGRLTEQYGPHNGIVIQADKAYEGLLKQLGLTKIQFADLIAESDATGVSITELVNEAHAVADAFKTMGITSSAQVRQMAEDNREAYNQIVTDVNSSLGDIYRAKQSSLEMDHRERDSLDGVAQAYKDLGIQSSQAIRDSIEKMTVAYDQLREVGGQAFGDLQRASDALREKQFQLGQSTRGMEDNYKALGITSSAQFQHMSDEAHIRLDRIRADGDHTYGDMQAALAAVEKADANLRKSIYGTDDAVKGVGRSSIQFGSDGSGAFDRVHASIRNVNAALLDMGTITVDDTSKLAGLVGEFGVVASSAAAAARAGVAAAQAAGAAGDAAMKNYGMLPPSSFGGSGSSGMGSFQLGTQPGQFTITHPASGGFDLFQNYVGIGGGNQSAQQAVEAYMANGYSFADAKSKAHFDGYDVNGVTNPKAASGGAASGGGASIGSSYTPTSGGIGTSGSSSIVSSVPGMTAEDVAAFLAMGVTLDQLKAATAPGPALTQSTKGSLMSMQEQGFTLPSGVTIPTGNGPSQLVGMGSQEFQLPPGASLTTQNGPAQLVGMSSMGASPAATNYSFSTTPTGGLTAAQVQAEQNAAAAAQLSYWSNIPQTPYTPPAGTAKPVPTVQQTADLGSLQFGGGITAGMTFEQMSALAATVSPPPVVPTAASIATTNIPQDLSTVATAPVAKAPATPAAPATDLLTVAQQQLTVLQNILAAIRGGPGSPTSVTDGIVAQIQTLGVATGKV